MSTGRFYFRARRARRSIPRKTRSRYAQHLKHSTSDRTRLFKVYESKVFDGGDERYVEFKEGRWDAKK